ncbi:class I SAM-dependent methyltransferase [Thalassospira povalilytica]|uniref:class I SAM-dependent methyltransferase n=1 Tax=Thalassospira povalilytica TaxID=732237 RepID=UPI001D1952F6|nr:class I SAM-dependent methyltransferase [Thalassospira povalilytica]MCC4241900.1 class I SAM-dependent methyltransferase [Thalassospira povalilytica]
MTCLKSNIRNLLFKFPGFLAGMSRIERNRSFSEFEKKYEGALKISDDRMELHRSVRNKLENGPIDYLEFGVYSGKSFIPWLKENTNPSSRFYGFDTFTGLPEDWHGNRPKGTFDVQESVPDTDGDKRATFIAGTFQSTLAKFLNGYNRDEAKTLVVHIDCDIFSGAIYALFNVEPYLKSGDIVIFDEFKDHNNEFFAFDIFVSTTNVTLQPFIRSKSNNQWAFFVTKKDN